MSSLGYCSFWGPASAWGIAQSGCAWHGLGDSIAARPGQSGRKSGISSASGLPTFRQIYQFITRPSITQPPSILSSTGVQIRQAHLHRLTSVIRQGFILNQQQLRHQCPMNPTPGDTRVNLCKGHRLGDHLCLLRAQVGPPGHRNQQGTQALNRLRAALLSSDDAPVLPSLMRRTQGRPLNPTSGIALNTSGEPTIRAGDIMDTRTLFFDYYGSSADVFCFHVDNFSPGIESTLCTTSGNMATLQMVIMFKGVEASYDFWLSIPHFCHHPCVEIVACVIGRHIDSHFDRQKVSFHQSPTTTQ